MDNTTVYIPVLLVGDHFDEYSVGNKKKSTSEVVLLFWILLVIYVSFFCHAVFSVHCSLVVTWWERADLLVLLYVMFSCFFVTFPCSVLGQMWFLIVSIPNICLFPHFEETWLHMNLYTEVILYHNIPTYIKLIITIYMCVEIPSLIKG